MGPQICKPTTIKGRLKSVYNENTKQITIINLFNKLASMGLQICRPMPDSFYNGNVHYKMEGVILIF